MLVDMKFPEPDVSEGINKVTQIVEAARARIITENRATCVTLEGDPLPRYISKDEERVLMEFFARFGWEAAFPQSSISQVKMVLTCSRGYYKEKLMGALVPQE